MNQEDTSDFVFYGKIKGKSYAFPIKYADAYQFCVAKKFDEWDIVEGKNLIQHATELSKKLVYPAGLRRSIRSLKKLLGKYNETIEGQKYVILSKGIDFAFEAFYSDDIGDIVKNCKELFGLNNIQVAGDTNEDYFKNLMKKSEIFEDFFVIENSMIDDFIKNNDERFKVNKNWKQLTETIKKQKNRKFMIIRTDEYLVQEASPIYGISASPQKTTLDLLKTVLNAKLRCYGNECIILQQNDPKVYSKNSLKDITDSIKNEQAREKFINLLNIDKEKIKKTYYCNDINKLDAFFKNKGKSGGAFRPNEARVKKPSAAKENNIGLI